MRVLVTGGAGFVGSNLCLTLLKQNHIQQVVCVDDLSTGRLVNIQDLLNREGSRFRFHRLDVRDKKELENVSSDQGHFDQIYHLACPASPPKYQSKPIRTVLTCVIGTLNILEMARAHGATVLFTSTSEVYGDPTEHPQAETYRGNVNTLGVRACYDEGKRVAETLCMDHHRVHKTKIRIVRIFNTYGPNMDPGDGRVITNFIQQALKHQDITVYGDGTQTRSFCYVDDLVRGLLTVMQQKQSCVGPINLGYPQEHTICALAALVKTITNSESAIVFKTPLPPDDPVRRKPDISLAEKLGWCPTVGLEQGLVDLLSRM